MSRNYSTRAFFRQMPNALLARYFAGHGVFSELDFTALPETKPDALFACWLELTDGQRSTMDAELIDIFEMGCEKGFRAILDEAQFHFLEAPNPGAASAFVCALSALASHQERAMVAFLDHPQFWKGATRFYHADTLSYWRKRKHLGHQPAAVDAASINGLAEAMRTYFHHTEGRGKNCVVEPFRRGDKDYFFAYPEDFSQQSVEWVDGDFAQRAHTPAFEVVYVYSQAEGSLDLNYRGAKKAMVPLQAMFAAHILKLPELPPDPKDARVYDLNTLKQRGFEFVYAPASGIESVVVKKLRLSSRVTQGERIALEADTSNNPQAVYALLDRIQAGLPLAQYSVTQVDLAVRVVAEADRPPKTVNIRLTHPNSCSLKYDVLDLKLRDMLSASGIEPCELAELTTPTVLAAVAPVSVQ